MKTEIEKIRAQLDLYVWLGQYHLNPPIVRELKKKLEALTLKPKL